MVKMVMTMIMMEKLEAMMNMKMRKYQSLESCSDSNVVHKIPISLPHQMVLRVIPQDMEQGVLQVIHQDMEQGVLQVIHQVMEHGVHRTIHQVMEHGAHLLDPQVRIPNMDITATVPLRI